jgi:hypothetical protein
MTGIENDNENEKASELNVKKQHVAIFEMACHQ